MSQPVTPDLDDDPSTAVVVAYVHSNEVTYSWHHSMVEMLGWDIANHGRIMRGGYVGMRCGTDGLIDSRNKAAGIFLDERNADWLFWVDTDMAFSPDTVDRLFEAADPVERPIVGGLCFTQHEQRSDGMGGFRCVATPTVFDWAKVQVDGAEQQGYVIRWDYPADTVTRVSGTGSACVLIHKGALEKIRAEFGPVWYDRVRNTTTGQMFSEDLSMCVRAGALDIPVYVHTGVRTTHQKRIWLSDEDYWQQRAVLPPPEKLPVKAGAPSG